MSDIPEDVMKVATQAFADADRVETVPEAVEVIARAILQERERCAQIAECEADDYYDRRRLVSAIKGGV